MDTQLVIVNPVALVLSTQTKALIGAAISDNTKRAYARCLSSLDDWLAGSAFSEFKTGIENFSYY